MIEEFEELGSEKLSEMPAEDFALFLGEQRLQVLLEEFEAIYSEAPVSWDVDLDESVSIASDEEGLAQIDIMLEDGWPIEDRQKLLYAARRYIIARDFNEFREGHWQTLWKLTWGRSL